MSSYPKISIVTPSFNQAPFVERTIQSVLTQQYPCLEYIIIDGGSKDGSVDIIKRYAPALSYWVSEKDEGQADAVAKGFNKSTGQILGFLNSDDMLAPNALFHVAAHFRTQPSLSVLLGAGAMIDQYDKVLYGTYPVAWGLRALLSLQSRFMQPAVFFSKRVYDLVGGINRERQFCLDLDLFVRLAAMPVPHRITYTRLAYTRLHPLTKTARLQDVVVKESTMLQKQYRVHPRRGILRFFVPYWRCKHFLLRCWFEGIRYTLRNRSKEILTQYQ